jgi:hypothetical protein
LLACNRQVAFFQGKVKDLIACNGYVAFFQETFRRTLLLAIGVLLSSMKDFEGPYCLLACLLACNEHCCFQAKLSTTLIVCLRVMGIAFFQEKFHGHLLLAKGMA